MLFVWYVCQLQAQYGVRGWALMELFLVGAAIMYSIVSLLIMYLKFTVL